MKTPDPLKKSSTVGLVSTARFVEEAVVLRFEQLLHSWGLKVERGRHLLERSNQFAGTDEQRLADIQGFIDDPAIGAIFCMRGGYGTVRIIDELNFLSLAQRPKWICGYSDVTVLHNALRRIGVESLHCTMAVNIQNNSEESLESMRRALFGEALQYTFDAHPFNVNGVVHGRLSGGNLSMLYSQLGSATALTQEGDILFLEDLDEYLYHIDRMMFALKRAGYFDRCAGLIIGGMSDMRDNAVAFGKTAEEIIRDVLKPYTFPLAFGFPAGHLNDNRSLIMGRRVELRVENQCQLLFDHG